MSTQLFVPKFRVEECLKQVEECLRKGWTGLGFKTLELEKAWTAYSGLPHAHFLNSNTSGLHIAVNLFKKRLKWEDGDEIITTPLTFVSTNHVILYERLTPVFADVDEHLCLDPDSIRERLTSRTRAVMFVGLGGNTGRYGDVVKLCRDRGLTLILDAAHMSGTRYRGRHVGGEADCAIFSFHAVKNLPTADSGMACFREAQDDQLARQLSWLGINKDTYARSSQGCYSWDYDVENVGFKYNGNSIMAALALVSLKYLDRDNAYRRQLVSWYESLLGPAGIPIVPNGPDCESSRHLFQIRVRNRDEIIQLLSRDQIFAGVHYKDNTEYPMYQQARGLCPNAHQASAEVISLPLHLSVTMDDVRKICAVVVEHARK
jgi:dTDP-4-amino-4,6-dideoxygalactose transaminase